MLKEVGAGLRSVSVLRSPTVPFPRRGLLTRARDDSCHAAHIVLRMDYVSRLDVVRL